jgi:DNA-directed RNA polymerase subunit M/transcription elongation factor TFIIS
MASYDSGDPPSAESLLSRRKKAIVAISMALFGRQLNQWLDNTPSELGKGRGKRVRDDNDSATEDYVSERGDSRGKKKRAKREIAATAARRFACPFCKHDPVRYKSVKTCCGPGWTNVHRVKYVPPSQLVERLRDSLTPFSIREHIYRRHSLKNVCPRCFVGFENHDELQRHQRAETPCKLEKVNVPEMINEDQEKKLHTRAKPNCSEEDKWQEMYRIIFPDAKVPSPCTFPTGPKVGVLTSVLTLSRL